MTKTVAFKSLADIPESLSQAVSEGKSIHISGGAGSGKGALLGLLRDALDDNAEVMFVDERYMPEILLPGPAKEYIPSKKPTGIALFFDPVWNIVRPRPDVAVIDGDNVLQSYQDNAELTNEEYLPYQHDDTLREFTVYKGIQVLSAGERSLAEMNAHLQEYRGADATLNYDIEVTIKTLTDGAEPRTVIEVAKLKN